jgi:hypothetical protein
MARSQAMAARPATHFPAEDVTRTAAFATVCRQVFGLVARSSGAGPNSTYWASLPGRWGPVLLRPVASTYRCGAVPGLHRIPFSIPPLSQRANTDRRNI